MMKYATRLPPGKPVVLLENNLIRKSEYYSMEDSFLFVEALVKRQIKNPDPLIVPVYNYNVFSDPWHKYAIFYDMMRCGLLDKEERAMVDEVGCMWDDHGHLLWDHFEAGTCKRNSDKLHSAVKKLPALADFLKTVVRQNRYSDLHSGM